MSETHKGIKFNAVFLNKNTPEFPENNELVNWAKKFEKLGLCETYGKGSTGNLSFRTESGFVITPTGVLFSKLKESELVMVAECNLKEKTVFVKGLKEPSSEAIMHWMIYNKRPEINAVFHLHDKNVLEKSDRLNLPKTDKEFPYGSIELAEDVTDSLGNDNYLIIKKHGTVAVGKSMEDTGNLALSVHKKSEKA